MDSTYELLSSPAWWITVVIAGIGINLFSVYLKTVLDSRLSRMSSWWNTRSEEKRKEREIYITRLIQDDKFFALNTIRHANTIKWTIMWTLVGLMGFLMAINMGGSGYIDRILLAIGAVCFFRGFQHLLQASRYASYAEEAIDDT